jgi:hypothetical protein
VTTVLETLEYGYWWRSWKTIASFAEDERSDIRNSSAPGRPRGECLGRYRYASRIGCKVRVKGVEDKAENPRVMSPFPLHRTLRIPGTLTFAGKATLLLCLDIYFTHFALTSVR